MSREPLFTTIDPSKLTLLLVDDEPNILSALRRLFHSDGFQVRLAASGPEGLAILERDPVDLIISDMRMPGMSGDEFLALAAERWPQIPRILLTGYADIDSTVRAVNRGRIFCYVAKPWDADDLRLSVRNALDNYLLQRERQQLTQRIQRQNDELHALNAGLEDKVRERTAELEQTVQMYELACEQLRHGHDAVAPVLARIAALWEGDATKLQSIAERARMIASHLKLEDDTVEDIYTAALLHRIGAIGLPDEIFHKRYEDLSATERALFETYPTRGATILAGVPRLTPVATLVHSHRERYDGSGFPDGLAAERIPLGARVVALAIDYEEIIAGERLAGRKTPGQTAAHLRMHAGSRYDPQVVAALSGDQRIPSPQPREHELPLAEAKDGMVLTRDLINADGILLLTRGHRLTQSVIDRLRQLERGTHRPLVVHVRSVE